jgi:2-polyprenyl-3-methyl-5-hydroxy-6-metoxy-1,4-benzoquinol methylase
MLDDRGLIIFEAMHRRAREFWKQDRPQEALSSAWAALDLSPDDSETKDLLVDLLHQYPGELSASRRTVFLRLLTDRDVDPRLINAAGWHLWWRECGLAEGLPDAPIEALVSKFERDELALTLLRQSAVGFAPAEKILTRVRHWLLLSGRWRDHPEFVAALKTQIDLNGGAWSVCEAEKALLDGDVQGGGIIAAYFPSRPLKRVSGAAKNSGAQAVKAQYEEWPYPPWTRVTVGRKIRLADVIRSMNSELANAMPIEAKVLIAGCGTGYQAADIGIHYPDAPVTAIDISEASLEYARRRCLELGITNVDFINMDLHDIDALGRRFHAIYCGGVLHHLPCPELGLKALTNVLEPGGVMNIMVYNRTERLMVAGARAIIGDLLQEVGDDDDLVRRVRRRLLDHPEHPLAAYVARCYDFATLAGTRDLLLHPHVDPFDVPRIQRALKHAGLRLLSFCLPSPSANARYDAMFPADLEHRNFMSWARFERGEIAGNYQFWGYKPLRR